MVVRIRHEINNDYLLLIEELSKWLQGLLQHVSRSHSNVMYGILGHAKAKDIRHFEVYLCQKQWFPEEKELFSNLYHDPELMENCDAINVNLGKSSVGKYGEKKIITIYKMVDFLRIRAHVPLRRAVIIQSRLRVQLRPSTFVVASLFQG